MSGLNGSVGEESALLAIAITVRRQLPLPTPTLQSKAMILAPRGSPSITFQTFEALWNGVPSSFRDRGRASPR
jgi:hypothetical protein